MSDESGPPEFNPEISSRSVPEYEQAAEARRATRREHATPQVREFDSGVRAQRLKALTWGFLGGIVGGLLGVFGMLQGEWGFGMVLILFALAWAGSSLFPILASNAAGSAATRMFAPSGSTTPHKREYSMAQSLLARGLYEDGIAAYEEAIAEDPSDPVPYLTVARTFRDKMGRPEDAATWFKRVLREPTISAAAGKMARRELVELFVSRMNEPKRAIPILARAAEELSGTSEGQWAAEELERLRQLVRDEAGPA